LLFTTLPAHPGTCPLSLHDALPISVGEFARWFPDRDRQPSPVRTADAAGYPGSRARGSPPRSWPLLRRRRSPPWSQGSSAHASRLEEHTSELQSRFDLVCRLLLEKK